MGRWGTEAQSEKPNSAFFRRPIIPLMVWSSLVGDHPTLRARPFRAPPLSEAITGSQQRRRPAVNPHPVGDRDQLPRQDYGASASSVTHCLSPSHHSSRTQPTIGRRLLHTLTGTHQGHSHRFPSMEGMGENLRESNP